MPMSKPLRNLSANVHSSGTVYRMTRPLRLEFAGAGIGGLDADEKHVIKEIVEGILLKHQAKRLSRS